MRCEIVNFYKSQHNYLGMVLKQGEKGYTISMRSYIADVLKDYGKEIKKCISPAKHT